MCAASGGSLAELAVWLSSFTLRSFALHTQSSNVTKCCLPFPPFSFFFLSRLVPRLCVHTTAPGTHCHPLFLSIYRHWQG